MAAIIHAVRSDNSSFNARFSYGLQTPGIYPPSGGNLPSYDVDATAIGGNCFNLDKAAQSPRMLFWDASQIPSTSRAISVLMRVKFGANGINCNLFERLGGSSTLHKCLLAIGVNSSNIWKVEAENELANAGLSNQTMGTDNVGTSNWIDMVFVWDGNTTANSANLYIDGVSLGTATSSLAMAATFNWKDCNSFVVGGGNFGTSVRFKLNEFVVWDYVIDPTSVALTSGTGSLNGNSRAAFVNVSSFAGATNTDPGVANVRNGIAYTIAGVALTGTVVVPSLANTKTGVAGDGGNGTYDGSDRWSDPGVANVRLATAYQANSTSNNRTGTAAIPAASDVRNAVAVGTGTGNIVMPTIAQVKLGVAFDSNGSLTGTFAGTCDYPAIAKVVSGTIYGNGVYTGTFLCYNANPGPGTAAQLTEKARTLIINYLKSNIHAELAAIRTDRNDPTVDVQDIRSWFIYDGAHTYQCPAIFVVADSAEIPDEQTGTNMITATLKFYVSVVVEGQDEAGLTKLSERYQSALFKLLHWQTLQDANFNVKDYIRVVRFQFSPLYTKTRKGENMGEFRKEVSLELEVKHYENPTT